MVVLVATLDNNNVPELLKNMNISDVEAIVVNQSSLGRNIRNIEKLGKSTIINSERLGLSASRNDAVDMANELDICYIADDDMVFVDQYDSIVTKAYQEFPDADFIVFIVDFENNTGRKKVQPKGRIHYLAAMQTSSVQISFKKSSFIKAGLRFDERFGIGAEFGSGEENILLFDALRKGLKIYSYPVKVAELIIRESQWDRSNTPENCRKRGAIYKRMTKRWYWLLILQFAIRKRKMMLPEISLFDNIRYMFQGAREFSKLK
ncbi:glycosyltransferase family 2 protein [Streptococcus suis]|uniref:glycosyltransferase family 2 protein n=1 Tax=Streptococcus suis TaxID=1307 RepID=UPI000CF4B866|nr:glycosyltransferase family A protein [Streptococcus suis]